MRSTLSALALGLVLASAISCAVPSPVVPPLPEGPGTPAPQPDATLEISAKSLAAGVGYSWGRGSLEYQGKTYGVTMDGLSIIALGFNSVTAKGGIYHLASLDDFEGDYWAVKGGRTLGEGGAGVAMTNAKGVEVRLVSDTQGVTLTLGEGKVKLALVK
ncbi:MAG TPA: hypothetical protein VMR86_02650 [Myxococcota bacterium]|nr:hypothetical protein [Myxococcota bacterium]